MQMTKNNIQTTKKNISILIVDDSQLWTERLVSILNDNNVTEGIMIAATCADAMPLLEKKPELVFLDINLPDKSGITLLQHIKTVYPEIKVCMTTNLVSPVYRMACKTIGADEFIDKTNEFYKIPFFLKSIKKKVVKQDSVC